MPTVRELAEQPGISVATISRALNNKPGISPDTRQKVLQLTGELQYSPNLAARNLTTSRTYNVLFLTAVANFSRRRILFTLHYAALVILSAICSAIFQIALWQAGSMPYVWAKR